MCSWLDCAQGRMYHSHAFFATPLQSIGERKNMNLPNVKVDLPVLQPKDIDDLQNFAVPQEVDFIAASFVQSAADIVNASLFRSTLYTLTLTLPGTMCSPMPPCVRACACLVALYS